MNQVLRVLKISHHQECGATAFEYGLLASQQAFRVAVGASALGADLGLFLRPNCQTAFYGRMK